MVAAFELTNNWIGLAAVIAAIGSAASSIIGALNSRKLNDIKKNGGNGNGNGEK